MIDLLYYSDPEENPFTTRLMRSHRDSVLPDASDFEHNATEPEASISSTLPDADETSQSDRLQRSPYLGEGSDLSYLPNASNANSSTTEAQDISMSTRRSQSSLSDAAKQDDDTVPPEDRSSFVSTENEDTVDLYIYKRAESDSLPAAENSGLRDQSGSHGSLPTLQ